MTKTTDKKSEPKSTQQQASQKAVQSRKPSSGTSTPKKSKTLSQAKPEASSPIVGAEEVEQEQIAFCPRTFLRGESLKARPTRVMPYPPVVTLPADLLVCFDAIAADGAVRSYAYPMDKVVRQVVGRYGVLYTEEDASAEEAQND